MEKNIQKQKFIQSLSETNWELYGDYVNNLMPIDLKCKKCNNIKHFKKKKNFNKWVICECSDNKINSESFKEILNEHNQTLLSEYKKLFSHPVTISCNKCNYTRTLGNASSFLKHPSCKKCNYKGFIYSQEEYLKRLNENGFHILWAENKMLSPECAIEIKCNSCDFTKKLKQFKNALKAKCKFCFGRKTKYNILNVKEICSKNGLEFLDEKYISINHYHNFKCLKNHLIKKPFSECLRAFKKMTNGCKQCTIFSLKNKIEDVKNQCLNKGFIFLDNNYLNANSKYNFKCCKCNYLWKTTAASIISTGSGCPKCNLHLNEKITSNILHELMPNIKIFQQKKIDAKDCSVRNHITVDFYFENNNKKYIIEYQGLQHYEPVNFSKKQKDCTLTFKQQQIRDEWLRNYCNNNSINLIEIDGRLYKKDNIKNYLIEKLNSHLCL